MLSSTVLRCSVYQRSPHLGYIRPTDKRPPGDAPRPVDAHKTSNGTAPKRTGARIPSRSTARERHHCSATRLAVTESRGWPHDALKQAHTGPRSVQMQGKSASRDATATSPHAKTTHELEDDDPPRPGTNLEPTRFEWAVSHAMRHAYPWA